MSLTGINNKRNLTESDRRDLQKWVNAPGFPGEVAKTVLKQGWMSDRQRAVFMRNAKRPSYPGRRSRSTFPDDYDESDWEIGAFELCVDGWGD